MFNLNEVWAYPTDTSFGLGVRCDDVETLKKLHKLKNRSEEKYFSLMVRDWKMLDEYAEIPENLNKDDLTGFPFTLLLKPRKKLPESIFWPKAKVAFRVCTITEIQKFIKVPVTATSANFGGEVSIYNLEDLKSKFKTTIKYPNFIEYLPKVAASQIWDYTIESPQRLR